MKEWFLSFFNSIVLFFFPIYGLLIAVGVAIGADTVFGVMLAKKLGQYKTKKLREGFTRKIISYQLSILSFYIIDYFALNAWFIDHIGIEYLLTKLLATALIFIEGSSINETSEKLYSESFYDKFCRILKKLQSFKKSITEEFKN